MVISNSSTGLKKMLRDEKLQEIVGFAIATSVIFITHSFHVVSAASPVRTDRCASLKNCTECIRQAGCAWCADPFDGPCLILQKYENRNQSSRHFLRCQNRDWMQEECTAFVQDPRHTITHYRNQSVKLDGQPVLISPQELNLTLRVHEPVTFTMEYLDPGDKPLDLFYLMDLSLTMEDDRDTVAKQGSALADSLRKLTKDLRMGFGSFIDKPMTPMATNKQLEGRELNSTIPYSFKIHTKLSANQYEFVDNVLKAEISANSDRPEGTLDAVMQAMACSQDVGWRDGSKKLIVVSTDGIFHIAGDAKLAGIMKPNDMECHMNNNTYTMFHALDYPSIAQIYAKAREEGIHLVFAVTSDMIPMYTKLTNKLSSASVIQLAAGSGNVVQVITEEYRKIKSTLKINQDPKSLGNLDISYSYNCNNKEEKRRKAPFECPIQPEGKLKFQITLELTSCPTSNMQVEIFPENARQTRLRINIQSICNCNCEKTKDTQKSQFCSNNGHLQCGQCLCDAHRRGRNCECDNKGNYKLNSNSCRNNNIAAADVCSGNGVCECDMCKCNELDSGLKYSGEYCQYDDISCKNGVSNGVSCSGFGDCVNGECQCQQGYNGTLCNCELDKEGSLCKEPGEDEVCNGQGQCGCPEGKTMSMVQPQCFCNQDGFTGKYCHVPTETGRQGSKCSEPNILQCVKCIADQGVLLSAKDGLPKQCQAMCNAKTKNKTIEFTTEIVDAIMPDSWRQVLCDLKDKDNCKVNYLYFYEESVINIRVFTRREGDCPEMPWWIIGTVVGSIVLIGILTLLTWKVFTHVQDSREYQRFEKEREEGNWSKATNPLYENPISEFRNPTYTGGYKSSEILASSSQ